MGTTVPPAPAPAGMPAPKKTSPIVVILLCVLGFFLFCAVAITALGFFAYHKAKQAGFDVALLQNKPGLAFLKMAVAANPDAEIVKIDEDRGIASIRDKKTGKVITMNFEDIKKGRISFESDGKKMSIEGTGNGEQGTVKVTSDEGTAQFGSGVVKLPSWLPSYTGSKLDGFSSEGASGSAGGFSFKTTDSAEQVVGFYENALKKAGFQVEVTKHPAGALLAAESGSRKATLNVSGTGGGASVSGTFEDK